MISSVQSSSSGQHTLEFVKVVSSGQHGWIPLHVSLALTSFSRQGLFLRSANPYGGSKSGMRGKKEIK